MPEFEHDIQSPHPERDIARSEAENTLDQGGPSIAPNIGSEVTSPLSGDRYRKPSQLPGTPEPSIVRTLRDLPPDEAARAREDALKATRLNTDDRIAATPDGPKVITAKALSKAADSEYDEEPAPIDPEAQKEKKVYTRPPAHVGTAWHHELSLKLTGSHPDPEGVNVPIEERIGYLRHLTNLAYNGPARFTGEAIQTSTTEISDELHRLYPGVTWFPEVLVTVNPEDAAQVEAIDDDGDEAAMMFAAVNAPDEPIFDIPEEDTALRRILWEGGFAGQGDKISAATLHHVMRSIPSEEIQSSPTLREIGKKVAAVLSYRDVSTHLREVANGRMINNPEVAAYLRGWLMNTSTRADAIGLRKPEGVSVEDHETSVKAFKAIISGRLWGRKALASPSSYTPEEEAQAYDFVERILTGEPMSFVLAEHKTSFKSSRFRPFPERIGHEDVLTPDQETLARDAAHTMMRLLDLMVFDVAPNFARHKNTLRDDSVLRGLQSANPSERSGAFVALYKRLYKSVIAPSEVVFTRAGGIHLFDTSKKAANTSPLFGFRPECAIEGHEVQTDVSQVDMRVILRRCNDHYAVMLKRRLDAYIRRMEKNGNA